MINKEDISLQRRYFEDIFGKYPEISRNSQMLFGAVMFGLLSYRFCTLLMRKTKLRGKDMHKKTRKEIPEGIGLGCGVSFICAIFWTSRVYTEHADNLLICACAITLNILLGYVDDTLDLSWGCKLVFPLVALFPLVMKYEGSTSMVAPFFGHFDLGAAFYFLLFVLSVFFTNAVNILSGINGVECGQMLLISFFLTVDRIVFFSKGSEMLAGLSFSLFTCTLGLFVLNRYPSRCFVGDTFCYFSGSSVLCIGMVGGFTKTVFLFFLPQLANFLFSAPQILGVIPCPRHRLPEMVLKGDVEYLVPSSTVFRYRRGIAGGMQKIVVFIATKLKIAKILGAKLAEDGERSFEITNFTILNGILIRTGPIKENTLFNIVAAIQFATCLSVIALKLAFHPGA